MYLFANFKTLAEINKTIEENSVPCGSRIIGNLNNVEVRLEISHEIRVVLLVKYRYNERGNISPLKINKIVEDKIGVENGRKNMG